MDVDDYDYMNLMILDEEGFFVPFLSNLELNTI
jgi:hypothetical protein